MGNPLKIVLWCIVLYLSYAGFIFAVQRRIIFPRDLISVPVSAPDPGATDFEPLDLSLPWGRVEAWFLPASGGLRRPAVIFAHGNGELIDHWLTPFQELARRGIGGYLVEFPGYGRSEGHPSQATITETLVAAFDRLLTRPDVDPARIVFMGRSVGGGAVCALIPHRRPAALILMSTFTSVRAMASRYLVPGFLVQDPFDNLSQVARFEGPVLILHGRRDDIIPYAHGQALAKASRKGRLISQECAHNDCPPDWDEFLDLILSFIKQTGPS